MNIKSQLSTIKNPILVASHPRSGTHLTIDVLRNNFSDCTSRKFFAEPLDRLYLAIEALGAQRKDKISEREAIQILQKCPSPILKSHAFPQLESLNGDFRIWQDWIQERAKKVYVYRDGRDVLCSFYIFTKGYDSSCPGSLSEFLRQERNGCSRVKFWAHHVNAWLQKDDVYHLRFEDVIRDTQSILEKIARPLGLIQKANTGYLPKMTQNLWHGRWNRLFTRQPESTAIIGSQKLKWKDCFSEADRAFFHQEAGALLQQLGYIDSDDWVNCPTMRPSLDSHTH